MFNYIIISMLGILTLSACSSIPWLVKEAPLMEKIAEDVVEDVIESN